MLHESRSGPRGKWWAGHHAGRNPLVDEAGKVRRIGWYEEWARARGRWCHGDARACRRRARCQRGRAAVTALMRVLSSARERSAHARRRRSTAPPLARP